MACDTLLYCRAELLPLSVKLYIYRYTMLSTLRHAVFNLHSSTVPSPSQRLRSIQMSH